MRPGGGQLTRVAAVDCGTNSIRLLIADVNRDELVDVHRELRIVRLGQGVDGSGRLAPEAIARTEVCQRWWAYMKDLMLVNPDNSPQAEALIEMFHQE